jgi:hypothetical protein
MRPKSVTVTSSNTPYLVPVDYRNGPVTVQADATGTVNYTVEYTVQNIYSITDPATNAKWDAVTNMSGATADQVQVVDASINCLKITHNSGAGSVTVHISQADQI